MLFRSLNINLAPELAQQGFDVTFVVHELRGGLVPVIPPGIRVVSLEAKRSLGALLPLIRYLRREKPALLLSSLGSNNIIALWSAALARVRTRIVVSQHNSMIDQSQLSHWQLKILPVMYRLFLWHADGVVAVSNGLRDELARIAKISRDRIAVIYNPVITPDFDERMIQPGDHPWLADAQPFVLAVGRLVEAKDYGTLLAAFASLGRQSRLRLIILGEGPLRENLVSQVARLGIADRVSLPGFVLNPLPFMRKAAVFVLSSRTEGFGNVLVEALACGTPVVSTSCPYGPDEILDKGRFGRLVPVGDSQAMAEAIAATLSEKRARESSIARGREFSVARAGTLYADLFRQLLAGQRGS